MPLMPPAALISSIASIVAWFSDVSMIAVVPVSEYSTPTLISPPRGIASIGVLDPDMRKAYRPRRARRQRPLRNVRLSNPIVHSPVFGPKREKPPRNHPNGRHGGTAALMLGCPTAPLPPSAGAHQEATLAYQFIGVNDRRGDRADRDAAFHRLERR